MTPANEAIVSGGERGPAGAAAARPVPRGAGRDRADQEHHDRGHGARVQRADAVGARREQPDGAGRAGAAVWVRPRDRRDPERVQHHERGRGRRGLVDGECAWAATASGGKADEL
ncbi:hypothetical protein NUW54_g9763 [Trametes sanguinea]|uniref:Uncharacterized protein n=1 Tax=Trametes sanguinea TaxID=158606 RepID=A0ACC1P3N5_9APHY|nr:hypothetical protein NUW54_g9763 [Trametes sanguinea]